MALSNTYASIRDFFGLEEKMAGTRRASDSAFMPMHQSFIHPMESTLIRPGTTPTYAIGALEGAVSGANYFEFDIGALGLDGALIVSARFVRKSLLNTTVRRRLMVHDGALVTSPAGDAAAFPLLWANRLTRCGSILCATPTAAAEYGAGSDATEWEGVLSCDHGIPVSPADGIVRVHSVLLDAYTASASVESTLELGFVA